MKSTTTDFLRRVRERMPLVHSITNFVVMTPSANILLALGAAPVMAHSPDEIEDMVGIAGALVLNIGTPQADWIDTMVQAGRAANARGIPVVLDPVGAGATRFRTHAARRLLAEVAVTVLRGNASEVLSVMSDTGRTRGVDSAQELSDELIAMAGALALRHGCVVAVSGAEDRITDGRVLYTVGNGHPIMTRVTGLGCGLSAVVGAFAAVAEGELVAAVAAAFAVYGLCGERAAAASRGPGSFYPVFLDTLASVSVADIAAGLKITAGTCPSVGQVA